MRAFRAFAATSLAAALVVAGSLTAHAATSTEVNVLTAASASWSTSGTLKVAWSWEDHRTGPDVLDGAVMVYVGMSRVAFPTTRRSSSGSGSYTGTFSTQGSPAALQVSVETYTCVSGDATTAGCRAPSLADAFWKVTIQPGQTLTYTRPSSAPAPTVTSAPKPTTAPARSAKKVSVRSLLAALPVRPENHSQRYLRDRFGYDNSYDADGDGCSTRKEVLIRDALQLDKVSSSCAVYGRWKSLYDGRVTTNPYSLEVDHLVPLAEAWYSGATRWTHQRQVAFGNDVGYRWDLQAVTASANQDKGAGDPADWMPRANRCTYIAAWVGVKARWRLSVDRTEKAAITRWLQRCGDLTVLKPGTPDLRRLAGF